ncbi:type II toxin-antitoxin system HicB family antitoxin [bacterium]|nr:MAG: type II toxin-antitoxin system HicB family antitoxin [bacterium]
MIFKVILHKRDEDGFIPVQCPSLPGCWSQGKTEEEAIENIREAIVGWLLASAEETELCKGVKEVEVLI